MAAATRAEPVWLRSWRFRTKTKKKRIHIEVRDPNLSLAIIKSYRGKDHTFHIILTEGEEEN
jgi:hypothetical protein